MRVFVRQVTLVILTVLALFTWLGAGVLNASFQRPANRRASTSEPAGSAEVIARGLREPVGVAVAPDGHVFFTDERAGTVFELAAPDTGPRVLVNTLWRPRGILWEDANHLLVVADGLRESGDNDKPRSAARGVIVRLELTSREVTVLADGLRRPRGLARASDVPELNGHVDRQCRCLHVSVGCETEYGMPTRIR